MSVPNGYIHTCYYPQVGPDDTLVLVFDEVGGPARPRIFVSAAEPNTVCRIFSGVDLLLSNWTLTETIALVDTGVAAARDLPITAAATINKNSAVSVSRGAVSVSVHSPIRFNSYLRQPYGEVPPP